MSYNGFIFKYVAWATKGDSTRLLVTYDFMLEIWCRMQFDSYPLDTQVYNQDYISSLLSLTYNYYI